MWFSYLSYTLVNEKTGYIQSLLSNSRYILVKSENAVHKMLNLNFKIVQYQQQQSGQFNITEKPVCDWQKYAA